MVPWTTPPLGRVAQSGKSARLIRERPTGSNPVTPTKERWLSQAEGTALLRRSAGNPCVVSSNLTLSSQFWRRGRADYCTGLENRRG